MHTETKVRGEASRKGRGSREAPARRGPRTEGSSGLLTRGFSRGCRAVLQRGLELLGYNRIWVLEAGVGCPRPEA